MQFACNGENINLIAPTSAYHRQVRVGSVAGSVIRRSSLVQRIDMLESGFIRDALRVSLDMWDRGLRIIQEPQATYYTPESMLTAIVPDFTVQVQTLELWQREVIG
jgi:hypothetical protein